jgi:hypothetical protein
MKNEKTQAWEYNEMHMTTIITTKYQITLHLPNFVMPIKLVLERAKESVE